MRELIYTGAGSVEWREAPDPELQGPGEALVRPLAVAMCDLDVALLRGQIPFQPPFALGHEFVAEVVEAGSGLEGIAPGQRVVVPFQPSCGACDRCRSGNTSMCREVPTGSMYGIGQFGGDYGGALSDLVRVPFGRAMLVPLPDGIEPASVASLSDNVADGWRAVAPPLSAQPGAPVLVVGGGAASIGLYAVHIAVALGSERVTYLDSDPGRLALAAELGAEAVETDEPPSRTRPRHPVTVDASGTPAGLACALRSTEPGGTCTVVAMYFGEGVSVPMFEMYVSGVTLVTGRANSQALLPGLVMDVASGRIQPERVTSRVVAWEDAPDALADPPTKLVVAR